MKFLKRLIPLVLVLALVFTSACSILPFEAKTLKGGKVGVEYSDSIATGTNNMYYDLDYDSELPRGLVLYDDGTVTGIPEQAGIFTFKAVMIDWDDNEYYADFTISIEKGSLSYTSSALKDGKTGEPYLANIATATGMPSITYTLKAGTLLPAGLNLSADGVLSGIPSEAVEDLAFTVVASAEGCDSVEAVYTINIEQGEQVEDNLGYIVFENFALPDGLVGETYEQSVRKAYGVPNITYKFNFSGGNGLPAGMSGNKDLGLISGTPRDSTDGQIRFRVIASAEGYQSVTAYVTLTVYDVYVETTKFETELVDSIPSMSGAGYSSAPSGRGMIQSCPNMSGGKSLGYLNKPADVVYKITSEADTTAKLVLGLGSENGDFTYDNSRFKILVNGEEVNYGTLAIKQTGTSELDFASVALTISPLINLIKGENIITFSIMAADDAPGTFGAWGCLFDYIELKEINCKLGWRPRVANLG